MVGNILKCVSVCSQLCAVSNAQATSEGKFMKELNNTEAELKKSAAYKKSLYLSFAKKISQDIYLHKTHKKQIPQIFLFEYDLQKLISQNTFFFCQISKINLAKPYPILINIEKVEYTTWIIRLIVRLVLVFLTAETFARVQGLLRGLFLLGYDLHLLFYSLT